MNITKGMAPWHVICYEVDGLEWCLLKENTDWTPVTQRWQCTGHMETEWIDMLDKYKIEPLWSQSADWWEDFVGTIPLYTMGIMLRYRKERKQWQD